MGFANVWYSHPRQNGQGCRCCRACSNAHGLIRKYGFNICRQCFREYAKHIGFKKFGLDIEQNVLSERRSAISDTSAPKVNSIINLLSLSVARVVVNKVLNLF